MEPEYVVTLHGLIDYYYRKNVHICVTVRVLRYEGEDVGLTAFAEATVQTVNSLGIKLGITRMAVSPPITDWSQSEPLMTEIVERAVERLDGEIGLRNLEWDAHAEAFHYEPMWDLPF